MIEWVLSKWRREISFTRAFQRRSVEGMREIEKSPLAKQWKLLQEEPLNKVKVSERIFENKYNNQVISYISPIIFINSYT